MIVYAICFLFHRHPSLDAAMRALPPNAQIEAGLNVIGANRSTKIGTFTHIVRREDDVESVAAASGKIAEASSTSQPILIQEEASASLRYQDLVHLKKATKMASTVTNFMKLVSKTIASIHALEGNREEAVNSMRRLLETRLA